MLQEFVPNTSATVVVVGDVILDRYVFGAATRISPEAPVPVVTVNASEERAGGAANVATNISALGIPTQLLGLVGKDAAAASLADHLSRAGVDCRFQEVENYPTITKMRVVCQHQQLLRLDYEVANATLDTSKLVSDYSALLKGADCVVLSDYAKGCLGEAPKLIAAARKAGVPVFVDPKGREFSRYQGATLLTPNLKEFEAVAGQCDTEAEIERQGLKLCRDLQLEALLVTRGERGVTLIEARGGSCVHLPARAHEVFDVTGAGDTVIAALAAARVSGYELAAAAEIANAAAGLVVEKLGTAAVSARELNTRLRTGNPVGIGIMSRDELIAAIDDARRRGERIVMTNGCFDLLHSGHVQYLQHARTLGDRLIVAVNDDDSVRRLKGPGRPINRLRQRMAVLAALSAVDWVTEFSEDTPERLIKAVKPDILVKGGDYQPSQIAGGDFVKQSGGQVLVLPLEPGSSTSSIIDSIRENR